MSEINIITSFYFCPFLETKKKLQWDWAGLPPFYCTLNNTEPYFIDFLWLNYAQICKDELVVSTSGVCVSDRGVGGRAHQYV